MRCVTDVARYHSATRTVSVAMPTASREGCAISCNVAWDPGYRATRSTRARRSTRATSRPLTHPRAGSVGPVGEFLELGIAVDHLHVFVADVARCRRHLGDRAGAFHELADLRHPLVDVGRALGAVHDLELPREVECRPGVELLLHRRLADRDAADVVELLHH